MKNFWLNKSSPSKFSSLFRAIAIDFSLRDLAAKWQLTILMLVGLMCFLIFLPFYPGKITLIDVYSYWYSASNLGEIGNWHPPFLQYFWRFLGWPGGLFIFNLLCYWLGLTISAFALFKNIYFSLIFLFVIGFFPANIPFITLMVDDALVFSNLILAFSFLFIYIFRLKKSFFLWLSLLFFFMSNGFKQDIILYSFLPILLISYLLLKHYIRYYKVPGLDYHKKKHIFALFFILMLAINGGVFYINSLYEKDQQVIWQSLINWDLKATSIYAQKNLFYPYLVKKEFQGKISAATLFQDIQKEFIPESNHTRGQTVEAYTISFSTLTPADKIYIINQLSSNWGAYLLHRLYVSKLMLLSTNYIYPIYRRHAWENMGVKFNDSRRTNIALLSTYLQLKTPRCYFFYLIISILLIMAIMRLWIFNMICNNIERLLITILAASGWLLFFGLMFLTPSGIEFRYHLPIVYSAEITSVLFLRAFCRYFQQTFVGKV